MPIVGGLDIHRQQITFDYPGTVTGQVQRGQVSPADREHLRAWLARFAGCEDAAFAVEGCTGWRYIAEELAAAWVTAHLAEPGTAFARGRKRHAKTDKTDCLHPAGMLLAEGRLPECWIPPARILECRALPGLYHDLRRGTPHGCSGSTRCCSTTAPRRWARVRCGPGRAWPRCRRSRRAGCHRPGSCRSRPRWRSSRRWRPGWTRCGAAADRGPGPDRRQVLAARLYGVGPVTALAITCWLAGADRFSSSRQAVRFAGLDVTVWSSDRKGPPGRLSRQGPPVLRWAVYEAGKTHARSSAPDYRYYAQVKDRCNGKRAALSEARKILRQAHHILAELGDDALDRR